MKDDGTPESPDSDAAAPTEGEKGQPDLDSLLASYDKDDGKQQDAAPDTDTLSEVRALRSELAERDYRDVMDKSVIPVIKGDLNLPDDYIEHWVNKQADADPRLMKLWDNRRADPSSFQDAMRAMKPKFDQHVEEAFKIPADSLSSPDRNLLSAVKGSRTNDAPRTAEFDNVDWTGMSDHDLALKKREVFNAAEKGQLR